MKHLLLSLFLVCTLSAFSQEKNDKKVSVVVNDTANLFNRLSLAFYEKGYTFETKDQSVGFIKTKEKEMERYSPTLTYTAFIKGDTLMLSAKMKLLGTTVIDVFYTKQRRNAFVDAWNEMVDIAKQFGNKITYSK